MGSRKIWKLLFFVLLAAGILLWLEWMGSEQEMVKVEQPIALPESKEG